MRNLKYKFILFTIMTQDLSIRSRLTNAYGKLVKSHLVVRHDTSEESLAFFEEHLNDALPRNENDNELDQVRVIKDIYHNAPSLAYRAITAARDGVSRQSVYVLWTNAWCITRHFKIDELVKLEWNQESKTYKVQVLEPESTQRIQTVEPRVTRRADSSEWKSIEKKKYRTPRKGKHGERRQPKQVFEQENKSEPVPMPVDEQLQKALSSNEPWA